MDIFAISVCALLSVILGAAIKKNNREYALLMTICTVAVILIFVFQKAAPFVEQIMGFMDSGMFDVSYLEILLKAVGITIIGQIAMNICKDAGENTLAYTVDLASKAAILILSLPILTKLFDYLGEIIRL